MEGTVGEIRMFAGNFAPRGWAFCRGQLIAIASNTALFSILGTYYGGNGTSTFGLPDMQGRVAIGAGQGQGLTSYVLGEETGSESVTLIITELPIHTHAFIPSASASVPQGIYEDAGTLTTPVNNYPAFSDLTYSTTQDGSMGPQSVTVTGTMTPAPVGGTQPHSNMQPYLAMNYIICMQGIYPARN